MYASLKGRVLLSMAAIAVIAAATLVLPLDASARVHPINDRGKPNFDDCLKLQNEIDKNMSAIEVSSQAIRQARSRGGLSGAFEAVRWQAVMEGIANLLTTNFTVWNALCKGFNSPFKTGPTCQLEGREGDEVPVYYSRPHRLADPGAQRLTAA